VAAEEMKADARLEENLEKRIDFLNARIAAKENLLTQTSDAGKRQELLQEYSAEVKALKDLFEARATLRNTPPQATHRP
jgi:DNA repair exonuclease SbcCD ATPase subunit